MGCLVYPIASGFPALFFANRFWDGYGKTPSRRVDRDSWNIIRVPLPHWAVALKILSPLGGDGAQAIVAYAPLLAGGTRVRIGAVHERVGTARCGFSCGCQWLFLIQPRAFRQELIGIIAFLRRERSTSAVRQIDASPPAYLVHYILQSRQRLIQLMVLRLVFVFGEPDRQLPISGSIRAL